MAFIKWLDEKTFTIEYDEVKCPVCAGFGSDDGENPCPFCGGHGAVDTVDVLNLFEPRRWEYEGMLPSIREAALRLLGVSEEDMETKLTRFNPPALGRALAEAVSRGEGRVVVDLTLEDRLPPKPEVVE